MVGIKIANQYLAIGFLSISKGGEMEKAIEREKDFCGGGV